MVRETLEYRDNEQREIAKKYHKAERTAESQDYEIIMEDKDTVMKRAPQQLFPNLDSRAFIHRPQSLSPQKEHPSRDLLEHSRRSQ